MPYIGNEVLPRLSFLSLPHLTKTSSSMRRQISIRCQKKYFLRTQTERTSLLTSTTNLSNRSPRVHKALSSLAWHLDPLFCSFIHHRQFCLPKMAHYTQILSRFQTSDNNLLLRRTPYALPATSPLSVLSSLTETATLVP